MDDVASPFDEHAGVFLPEFLTKSQQSELLAELKKFPAGSMEYYWRTNQYRGSALQGDAYCDVELRSPDSGEHDAYDAVLLSNTCDVDPQNVRNLPMYALLAPLVSFDAVKDLLHAKGVDSRRAHGVLESLQGQRVTNAMYFPPTDRYPSGAVLFFDTMQSVPVSFLERITQSRIWRLNQSGFYCLLLKVSIHFTRFGEQIARFEST